MLTNNTDQKEAQYLENMGIRLSTEEDISGMDSEDNEDDEEDVIYENPVEKRHYLTLKYISRTCCAEEKCSNCLIEEIQRHPGLLGEADRREP